jgi:SAM-dependent methyltransferase
MGKSARYKVIAEHYETCLEKHGDTPQGVDWPKPEDVATRHQVMLDLIREGKASHVSLLDFGCGTSDLRRYILEKGYRNVSYSGLDISEKFIEVSRKKYPEVAYYCMDVVGSTEGLPVFDYVVLNGVFTQKRELSFEEMFNFQKSVIRALKPHARTGIAFNMMSPNVDWKRDGAFHLPFADLADFLVKEFSRYFVLRHDYGLYEYTAYAYRDSAHP